MADLQASFEAAVAASKTLSERPDNSTLLQIYAAFQSENRAQAERDRADTEMAHGDDADNAPNTGEEHA